MWKRLPSFLNLYKGENVSRPSLEGIVFSSISQEPQRWLERDFEVEEVERALSECGSGNALGPNGFNFYFIKAGWSFLKNEFIDMLTEFHHRFRLNRAINSTFLTLIPKLSNPVELRE